MIKVKKGRCILINIDTQKIALVCRNGEYSFPKGHLEKGESIKECAVRETKEETGHNCHLVENKEIDILYYKTFRGEDVECYYYLAIDDGICDEVISKKLKEIAIWKEIEDIEETLSYKNIKEMWKKIKVYVENVINNAKM